MKILCNTQTKKIIGVTRATDFEVGQGEIQIETDYWPDEKGERLNNTTDGLRVATQAELDADTDAELDAKVDFANVDPFLKAYVLAVNDGSIVPGSNMTGAAIKAAIKDKL